MGGRTDGGAGTRSELAGNDSGAKSERSSDKVGQQRWRQWRRRQCWWASINNANNNKSDKSGSGGIKRYGWKFCRKR